MAVYRWIYANAKMEGGRKDYQIRICDKELERYRGILIELSNRLLSVDRRRGETQRQKCWFCGYLDEKVYVVAVGGDQGELLGIEAGRYRPQYCVLAYGFTKEDIHLYKKTDEMFEPLKIILRNIQETGREDTPSKEEHVYGQELLKYTQASGGRTEKTEYNIVKSTPGADENLWQQSLTHPVMTGIISAEDGKKLLKYFPDGAVTVLEDVRMRYVLQQESPVITANSVKPDQNENHTGKPERSSGQNRELEKLRSEQEEMEKRLRDIRDERSRKEGQTRNAAVLIFLLIVFALFFWFL